MGLPSNRLARDPHAMLPELAREFFHTWNLVAIHPDSYGALSYQRPNATTGLWMGEGVTLHYADLLLRRTGLADTASTRLAHLADLLTRYYAAPWRTRVSPERASLAFGASPVTNADATGGYYLQGELLAHVLDALVRDSTHERRGLDDVMKTLYVASADGAGFTSRGLERTVDSVCHCALHHLFESQIRGAALIDATPVLSRIGLRIVVDTVPATDATGSPLPDRRLGVDFSQSAGPLRLVVNNPASVWSSSGLQTGDALVALGGSPVTAFADYRRALQAARVGDTIVADVQRDGRPLRVVVRMSGYQTPRVRFVDLDRVTPEQRARRYEGEPAPSPADDPGLGYDRGRRARALIVQHHPSVLIHLVAHLRTGTGRAEHAAARAGVEDHAVGGRGVEHGPRLAVGRLRRGHRGTRGHRAPVVVAEVDHHRTTMGHDVRRAAEIGNARRPDWRDCRRTVRRRREIAGERHAVDVVHPDVLRIVRRVRVRVKRVRVRV